MFHPLVQKFLPLSKEEKYHLLMEMGKALPPFPSEQKKPENLVHGCQSLMYLYGELQEGKIHFWVESDALISKGLAALLLQAYNGRPPQTLFLHPPHFLQEIGLDTLLSPGRSHGLAALFQKMQSTTLLLLKTQNH